MNTSSTLVTTTTHTINCGSSNITNLFGIQYFTSLDTLFCYFNYLTTLPALPNSLTYLKCGFNSLTALPALPNSLTFLECRYNSLTSLPALPNSLQTLWCDSNNIACFPTFPNSITSVDINGNPYNCLPNYVLPATNSYTTTPLCAAGNSNGCPVTTGIEQYANSNEVSIYPNPFGNQISIENKNQTPITKVSVSDLLGRELVTLSPEQKGTITIDTQNFAKGAYFAKVYKGNNSFTVKLIKE